MNYITKYLLKLLIILSLSSSLSLAESTTPKGQLPAYLIGPGDVLEIAVWKEEGLQKEVLVRPDGALTFPLADEIQAGGRTVKQLQQALADKIKAFIPDPVITVSVLKINHNKIFVVGKVGRPGEFVASQYVDVMQALAMAGGLNAYASSNDIKILRRVAGKEISLPFEYDVVAQGKELEQNIILKSGDVVVVP
jgi:polysaccharide export outer membrane protein